MGSPRHKGPEKLAIWISELLAFCARPFADAGSLAAYSDAGYALLGLILFAVYSVLFSEAVLSVPIAHLPIFLKTLLDAVTHSLDLAPTTSVLALPVLIWAVGWTHKGLRRYFGERTANLLFLCLERIVSLGEWCMEHRWASVGLIIVLASGLAAGIGIYIENQAAKHEIERDLQSWYQSAEQLLLETPLTRPEVVRYRETEAHWHNSFSKVLPKTHPLNRLHDLLRALFEETSEGAWAKTISLKEQEISKLTDLSVGTPFPSGSYYANEARALLLLTRARLLVRVARVDKNPQLLTEAHQRLKSSALNTLFVSATENALGTC